MPFHILRCFFCIILFELIKKLREKVQAKNLFRLFYLFLLLYTYNYLLTLLKPIFRNCTFNTFPQYYDQYSSGRMNLMELFKSGNFSVFVNSGTKLIFSDKNRKFYVQLFCTNR